jgi:hypothetical protein
MPATHAAPHVLTFHPDTGVDLHPEGHVPAAPVILARGVRRTNDLKWWLSTREAQAALGTLAGYARNHSTFPPDGERLRGLFEASLAPWCIEAPAPGVPTTVWTSLGCLRTPPVEFVTAANGEDGEGGPGLPDLQRLISPDPYTLVASYDVRQVATPAADPGLSFTVFVDEEGQASWRPAPRAPWNETLGRAVGALTIRGHALLDATLPADRFGGYRARASADVPCVPDALYPYSPTPAPVLVPVEAVVEWTRVPGGTVLRVACPDIESACDVRDGLRLAGFESARIARGTPGPGRPWRARPARRP